MSSVNELSELVPAPDFNLPDMNNNPISLDYFQGNWLVLYFYPKDSTTGCTLEAQTFNRDSMLFKSEGALIAGVSPDSLKSHCSFADKYNLTFLLLSDEDHSMAHKYGVWKLKKMYGKEYYGVERSTFLIDPKGIIRGIWRKVKVDGHSEEVLAMLKEQKEKS